MNHARERHGKLVFACMIALLVTSVGVTLLWLLLSRPLAFLWVMLGSWMLAAVVGIALHVCRSYERRALIREERRRMNLPRAAIKLETKNQR